MSEFFRTQMGHRFYESTMPSLVRELARLNTNLERLLAVVERDAEQPDEDEHRRRFRRSRDEQAAPASERVEPETKRCAIYTRKSTTMGLEQEFNSLDAQRESCLAYIERQQGWKLVDERYDDGGFTGANIDRPAFTRLMADVEAGKVDVIVVYKVDRLSRSLLDFVKVMERLSTAGASFVSITQNFSTADAMGRLTMNMLMSFAEFEREMISERTRDKIAGARRKGKWTGGPVPFGYSAKDKKLLVNEPRPTSCARPSRCSSPTARWRSSRRELNERAPAARLEARAQGRTALDEGRHRARAAEPALRGLHDVRRRAVRRRAPSADRRRHLPPAAALLGARRPRAARHRHEPRLRAPQARCAAGSAARRCARARRRRRAGRRTGSTGVRPATSTARTVHREAAARGRARGLRRRAHHEATADGTLAERIEKQARTRTAKERATFVEVRASWRRRSPRPRPPPRS
jgi:DNA invertase Pin-like site-specific DNA recombinase